MLVNNAGLTDTERHFLEADEDWWDSHHRREPERRVTLRSAGRQADGAQGAGVIINVSSGGATRAHRGNAAYDAAKGGIEALTRAMALDLGPYGVRVNGLVPGSIDTQGHARMSSAQRGANVPLGRIGDAEDMAGPAVFLASDDARYVTGHHRLRPTAASWRSSARATVDIFPRLDRSSRGL